MNTLRMVSAFAAGFFAVSTLIAADAPASASSASPAPVTATAQTPAAVPAVVPPPAASSDSPAQVAAPAETSASPVQAVEASASAQQETAVEQTAEVKTPVSDPASTVNEPEKLPAKPQKQPPTYKSSKLVPFVVITANYPTAIFLAETARKKAKCPIIIVPEELPFPEKGTLLTVKMPGTKPEIKLRAEDLSRFLAYLRPRNVIILGNTDVVPPIYSLAVPRATRTYQLNDRAWKVNATRLDDLLNTSPAIYKAYRRFNMERAVQAEKQKAEAEAKAAEAAKAAEVEKTNVEPASDTVEN